MANRYWVGGAGNWSSTTKWSTSSGGASGASVPTSADAAIFDANSGGKFTATVDTAQQVNSLTITPSSSVGALTISLTASLTTGALTTTGTAGNNRIFFTSTTYGIAINFVVTGAVSISDCDFRGIYVIGAAAPISGTRIGNRGECRGITFSTPKTVYWNLAGAQNWSANAWAVTSSGAPSTDNFPLPQDTATFTNAGSVTGTITLDTAIGYVGSIDMSGRTTAMTLGTSNSTTVYGSWTNGSGTALTGASTLTFSGGATQTVTSAGKTFTCPITVDTYGGTVQLADALNIGTNTLTVTNGTFTTQGYAVTAGSLSSSNSNVRTITLGSSTLTFSGTTPVTITTATNLTLSASTSQINLSSASAATFAGGVVTFYNVAFTGTTAASHSITGANTFNNLTFTAASTAGLMQCSFSANQTITGTLTCAGATAVRRVFLRADTLGTTRTLTVNSLSATDCDFRDITIAGAAAGSSPTRAGDCGGNTGITFPGAKTVYWNLAGAQNWSATGWCTGSGGTPDINQFPLAQDTAVFDNTGAVTGTITIDTTWNIGTFDASNRTSAMTLTASTNAPVVYGDWKFGTGVTSSSNTGTLTFSKRGTQTITSNGVTFGCPVTVDSISGTVQLADALTLNSARTLTITSGTFDAVSYNVTVGLFLSTNSNARSIFLRSGTWTLSGVGTVWDVTTTTNLNFYKGTAPIILSDTSTTARTFNGGGYDYTKLTIGGATGISTLTLGGNNTFYELASTKTVAHTIALGTTTQYFSVWSVTGTVGNIVTITGTSTIFILTSAVSGVDYLALGTTVLSTASYAEFYAGANSTGGTNFFLTTKPAARTLYWVGGTGNWSDITHWSLASGGAGGEAIPKSFDAVIFNSGSSATDYTFTMDVPGRMSTLNMAGPASGTMTFAGSGSNNLILHQSALFAATGVSRSFSSTIVLAGSGSGKTFTPNGVTFIGLGVDTMVVNSPGASWSFVGATNLSTNARTSIYRGSLDTAGYAITAAGIFSTGYGTRSLSFGASTITVNGSVNAWSFGTLPSEAADFTFNAGTSQINMALAGSGFGFPGNGKTFYNVSFTGNPVNASISGTNTTFNNLTIAARGSVGYSNLTINANITVNGTFTFSAPASAINRNICISNTVGTPRTITCSAVNFTDVDFRDITIAGAAAPASGTRLGNRGGNSGLTFSSKTVYWSLAAGGNWSATAWASTAGAAPASANFPMPQDTAVIVDTGLNSGATITVDQSWYVPTVNMSARTLAMTFATGTTSFFIMGSFTASTAVSISGTGTINFQGRTVQNITSAGKTFTQVFSVASPAGSVVLQDALTLSQSLVGVLTVTQGTFDANGYNVTLSGANSTVAATGTLALAIGVGAGTWSLAGAGNPWTFSATNATVTGTGTISLTSASAKTFAGGGLSYSGITINQGGAGTLTISGNNTFKNITNSYSATGATAISMGTSTQTVTQFTATGTSGNVLTVQGTNSTTPATLILTSGTVTTVDYLAITGVRAYSLDSTWYAGANSTNNGSLGWYFSASGGVTYIGLISETSTATDLFSLAVLFGGIISETATATDVSTTQANFAPSIFETATGTDTNVAALTMGTAISETLSVSDEILGGLALTASFADLSIITDSVSLIVAFGGVVLETASATDFITPQTAFAPSIFETATGTDSLATALAAGAAVYEVATGTDILAVSGTYNVVFLDSSTATDAVLGALTIPVSLSDTATATDAVLGLNTLYSVITETGTVTDALSARLDAAAALYEVATVTDAVSPIFTFNVATLNTATATDALTVIGTYNVATTASVTVTDAASGAFLWNPIDDTEIANWGAIDNTQSGTWTQIDDSQTSAWQNVNNTQASGWSEIDDSQDPNWASIQQNP